MKKIYAWILAINFGLFVYSSQVPLVFIEGNIGAGKSTLTKIIEQYLPVTVSLEPCDQWQDVQGINLLHEFYQNPVKYGFTFQMYALITRIHKQARDMSTAGLVHFMERSWFSDRYCFAQMMQENNIIDQTMWAVYQEIWQWHVDRAPVPTCFIYLRMPAEVCYQRLKVRGRSEEAEVPLAYLQKLHEAHERLFVTQDISGDVAKIPVLILDGSVNFKDDKAIQQTFMSQILDFLKIHGNIDLQYRNL